MVAISARARCSFGSMLQSRSLQGEAGEITDDGLFSAEVHARTLTPVLTRACPPTHTHTHTHTNTHSHTLTHQVEDPLSHPHDVDSWKMGFSEEQQLLENKVGNLNLNLFGFKFPFWPSSGFCASGNIIPRLYSPQLRRATSRTPPAPARLLLTYSDPCPPAPRAPAPSERSLLSLSPRSPVPRANLLVQV